jgi:uncharacterized protein
MDEPRSDSLTQLSTELASLRERIPGVRGCIVVGVDGLLLFQDGTTGQDPHDLAALAAAAFGIGRQTGAVLKQGPHRDTTIHSDHGYYAIYSVNDSTLLGFIGESGLNLARLHMEFRASAERIDQALRAGTDLLAYQRPRL